MNNMAGNINNDGVRRNTYKFVFPDQWKTWNIKPADLDKQVARQTEMSASLLGNQTVISIAKGQAIESIINFAVYLCQDAQKWITGEANASPGGASQAEHSIIRYVTIFSDVKIVDPYWDPVLQDYTKLITYTMVPSESVKSYTDLSAAKDAIKPTTQLAKLQYLVQNNRIAKRYDYIYTGLNTEVLSLDIKIDNYWAINVPTWNQNNSYYQYSQGPLAAQDSQGWLQQKGLLPQEKPSPSAVRIAQIDRILNGQQNGTASYANGQPVNEFTGPSRLEDKLMEEKAALQSQIQAGQRERAIAQNGPSTSSGSTNNSTINSNLSPGAAAAAKVVANANANSTAANTPPNTPRAAALASRFIEDLKNANLNEPPPYPLVGMQDPKPTSINAQQNADQPKVKPLQDPQAYADGTGFVGAIFGNLFDRTAFLEIDLGIRGDPWWIPYSNITQAVLANRLAGNQAVVNNGTTAGQAEFLGGDNEILLQYRVGAVYDESTGLANIGSTGGDFVNGLYIVTNITNVFSHGKFTANLHCMKDILSQTVDVPSKPANPRAGDNVNPETWAPSAPPTAPSNGITTPDGALYGPGGLSG